MKPQNETPTPELNPQQDAVQGATPSQLSRRKFIMTAGVSSLPVMMSLKSGDAWGCIGLDCTPGVGNISGTRSAVLSAKSTQGQAYVVPKWDTITNIKKIVMVDFGRQLSTQYYGFLLSHYDFAYYYNKTQKKYILIKSIASAADKWLIKATSYMNSSNLFILQSGNYVRFNEWVDTKTKRKYPIIQPAQYNNIVLTGQTNLNSFFPGCNGRMNLTITQALNSTDKFTKFVAAAFIGSVWESHPIWATGYPGEVVKTNCYPKPAELMTAYNNVITRNAKVHKKGLNGALDDMGLLFEMYTKKG